MLTAFCLFSVTTSTTEMQ